MTHALKHPLTIIAGYTATGKTTLANKLVSAEVKRQSDKLSLVFFDMKRIEYEDARQVYTAAGEVQIFTFDDDPIVQIELVAQVAGGNSDRQYLLVADAFEDIAYGSEERFWSALAAVLKNPNCKAILTTSRLDENLVSLDRLDNAMIVLFQYPSELVEYLEKKYTKFNSKTLNKLGQHGYISLGAE